MKRSEGQPVVGVGVSGSGASTAALIWAAREACGRGARLRVIQAWQPYPLRALYAANGYGKRQPASRSAAADLLAARVRSALAEPRLPDLVIEVKQGRPEQVLADVSTQVDVLVLGSGGQSPVAQADPLIVDRPVGPVVRACLSHAHCPVVIITPALAATLTGPGLTDTPLVGTVFGERLTPVRPAYRPVAARG